MNAVGKSDDFTKGNTSWQMEVLMEKLRSKACGLRSLPESAKVIKQAILNKQHMLDPGEKATLGQCLDKLQQNIKVTSLPAMVERLEATARQLGLQFTSGASGPEVYISCDMFYVEVHLQSEGKVRDVKVELAGDQHKQRGQSSPELIECLSNGNFTDFMAHLEGFLSIYKLNTEKKSKCKAYQALQALELDLMKLFEMAQETITDTHRLIFKSPVGLLINRKGGHPVKMIYFNSPYELLDVVAQKSVSLTYETASSMDLAHFVSVNIETASSHKLQTTSLVNIIKGSDGLKLPSISGLNSSNSVSLPAYFTLRLKNPMAISLVLANKIGEITGIPCYESSSKQALLPLIIRQATDVQPDTNNNKGLFVTLPDQQHCYFMPTAGSEFEGVLVHRVPFTHPTSVAHILEYLRMQAVFNTLITSCVRPSSKQELDNAFIFEISAVSHEFVSVTFEHPEKESTATAELDLTDISNVKCRLIILSKDVALCSDEYATKVLQRCLSIPVTMRAVIRKVAKEEKKVAPQGDLVVKTETSNVPSDPNQNTKFLLSDYNLGMRRDQAMHPQGNGIGGMSSINGISGVSCISNMVAKSPSSTSGFGSGADSTSESANLSGQSTTSVTYSTLLGGVSVTSKHQFQHHFLADGKTAKVRKRKSALELDRKSPKFTEDIVIEVNKKSVDAVLSDANLHLRRDVKFEKVQNVVNKRRSSSDGLTSAGTSELAALREKVYGAGSAASFAKLSYMHNKESSKDLKDSSKKFKKQKPDSGGSDSKKSPIVLDLTDVESTKKASLGAVGSAGSHSSALSAALLKRPGIEIIPIPGSNTPISIPSSITVTPVMKSSSEDRYRDKKDKRDRKEVEKKDKKRRRDESPTGSSGSSSSSISGGKPSKIQIISSNLKHSSISSLESIKGEKPLSSITVKPSSSYQSPVKKSSLSPTISQKSVVQSKVTFSPSHKTNKLIYSPSQSTSSSSCTSSTSTTSTISSKGMTSPKQCCSPKHSSLSPKHSSIGKPSMNALKTNSPTFSKPSSLSPKLTKSGKEKEKSCSPSRPSVSPVPSGSPTISPTSNKSKGSSSGGSEKAKSSFSDALTITKVSSGETISSSSVSLSSCSSISASFSSSGQSNATSLMEKLSADKAKASPPKNRKGSSLSDIVDKLRAGASSSADGLTLLDRKDQEKRDSLKSQDGKKDGDNFLIKTSTGLKFTIKAKTKESSSSKSSSSNYGSPNSSSSPNSKNSKSPSGLKPGVMSAPASKKVSMSSLPPIPKLPAASISSVTGAVSSLGNSISMTSPLQYGRDRQRDSKDKDRSSIGGDKSKSKDSCLKNNSLTGSDGKKEASDKQKNKEDLKGGFSAPSKKTSIPDTVDRALKNMFGEEDARTHPSAIGVDENESGSFYEMNVKASKGSSCSLEGKSKGEGISVKDSAALENLNKEPTVVMPPPCNPPGYLKPSDKTDTELYSEKEKEISNSTFLSPTLVQAPPLLPQRTTSPSGIAFPPSPSVSIKIVKSPAPVTSPLNMISPQSVTSQHSPCIIDDELMDEALMGTRK